ncbi:hypothetical protein BgiMline_002308 [Biomphalaria glabrata]
MCEQINSMGKKVDKMVSRVDSLVKEQLPVDSLVKKLRGQDCGCTNSGDGDAGDCSAVCVCVVGKSCGCDFQDEKRDNDCCDDLNEISCLFVIRLTQETSKAK